MPTASRIYYAQSNEGNKDQPPVILIHGAGSSHLIWPAAIRRLNGQRVIALDLPGHGRSSGVAQQSISAYADLVFEFLAELGLFQAVFVGHSMGGAIALELAHRYPTHVAGLGLISTGAYLGIDPKFLENLSTPVTIPSALLTFQTRAFSPQTSHVLVERCMQTLKETRPAVLYGDWHACAAFDLRESIGQIQAPTWVINGSEDQVTPISYANFLADRIPAARLQMIPGAGHMALLEYPERVAQGLQQFLAALGAARAAVSRVHMPSTAPLPAYQRKNA